MDINIDNDEWVILRMAELRQRGIRARLCVVIDENKGVILDCYIKRGDGREERNSGPGDDR